MRDIINRSYLRVAVHTEGGQGMLEYALLISLVALGVIVGLALFGAKVTNLYLTSGTAIPG